MTIPAFRVFPQMWTGITCCMASRSGKVRVRLTVKPVCLMPTVMQGYVPFQVHPAVLTLTARMWL
jgi:hypothetical protein